MEFKLQYWWCRVTDKVYEEEEKPMGDDIYLVVIRYDDKIPYDY